MAVLRFTISSTVQKIKLVDHLTENKIAALTAHLPMALVPELEMQVTDISDFDTVSVS
jgi:hypothetical protein